jgi:hypothetical protein
MVDVFVRGSFQKADKFMRRRDLNPSMLADSDIELVMKDATMFFPLGSVSHQRERPIPTNSACAKAKGVRCESEVIDRHVDSQIDEHGHIRPVGVIRPAGYQ